MIGRKAILFIILGAAIQIWGWTGAASAEAISPAHEQEYNDARNAISEAQRVQADKYAPDVLREAQDLLRTAEKSRAIQDAVKFAQASRLSRAYAELARAMAELKSEEEKLSAAQEELQKARADIDQLKKAQ